MAFPILSSPQNSSAPLYPSSGITEHFYIEHFPLKVKTPPELKELPYTLCNEEGQEEIFEKLQSQPTRDNSVHLGFSCWFNYDLIALRNPAFSIICDIDPNTIAMLDLIKNTTLDSASREEFLEKFKSNIESRFPDLGFCGFPPLNEVFIQGFDHFKQLVTKTGWLSTQNHFETIKRLYQEGRITHQFLDIADKSSTFQELKNWALHHDLVFDTIYDSNIWEWLDGREHSLKTMNANLNCLINPQTYFITAWKRIAKVGHPELAMEQGAQPKRNVQILKSRVLKADSHPGPQAAIKTSLFNSVQSNMSPIEALDFGSD